MTNNPKNNLDEKIRDYLNESFYEYGKEIDIGERDEIFEKAVKFIRQELKTQRLKYITQLSNADQRETMLKAELSTLHDSLIKEISAGKKELTEFGGHFVDEEVLDRRNNERGFNKAKNQDVAIIKESKKKYE